jgi:hypothetical protein
MVLGMPVEVPHQIPLQATMLNMAVLVVAPVVQLAVVELEETVSSEAGVVEEPVGSVAVEDPLMVVPVEQLVFRLDLPGLGV